MSSLRSSYTRTRTLVRPSSAGPAWPAAPFAAGMSNLIMSSFMLTSTFGCALIGIPSNENTPCALALAAASIKAPNSTALPFISSTSSLFGFSRECVSAHDERVAQARADGTLDMSLGDDRALLQVAHRSLEVLRRRRDARVDRRLGPKPQRGGHDGRSRNGARERRDEI